MAEQVPIPDWIYPEAPVIVRRQDDAWKSRVKMVAKSSFTVHAVLIASRDRDARIRLIDLRSAWQGSTWSQNGGFYEILPPDSETALELVERTRQRQVRSKAKRKAEDAMDLVKDGPDLFRRVDDAITALQKYKKTLRDQEPS